ncbi:MAG: DUF1963 domain-containing protein [Bacteroidota bacterium]
MTKEEFEKKIRKPAVGFQVGGFRPGESILDSWFGKVLVGGEGESWPESEGKPMIPVCQINLREMTYRPKNLLDVEFLTLFIDSEELPSDESNGNRWLLRTYPDINKLTQIRIPPSEFLIKPFPMRAGKLENDYPCWEDCPVEIPDELEDDYNNLFPNQGGIKLGGWPTLIQGEIFWAPFNQHSANPEYIFQIDSVEKANWYWGDNGVAYIGRGTKPETKDEWVFSWQCY